MSIIKRMLVMTALAGVVMGLIAGNALAASSAPKPHEGSGGNNVVCNGVPTKALLIYYAKGGVDSCGHRDIAAIWAKMGITPQVAKMMHSGTVCSSDGLTSSGRNHSPNPSLDRLVMVKGGKAYFRPLSVWGKACYSAWVGRTEDGRKVAVLKGCGNGEASKVPPKSKPKTPAKPKTPPTTTTPPGSCNITITGGTVNGDITNCSTVTVTVICGNLSKTFTGPNAKEEATTWQQGNCNTVVTPPPCNCTPPPPPPPPVCPAGTTGTPPNCVTPPPASCVTITSMIDLNDVPIAKTSQQLPFTVNSCGSGSVTIDPGNGGISGCNSSTPLSSITFNLVSGNNSFCVIYYAPNDSSATSGSITYTAIQGSAKDVKTDSFLITQPTRP